MLWHLDLVATHSHVFAQAHAQAPALVDPVIVATGLRTPGRLAVSAGLAFDAAAGGSAVDGRSGATSQAGIDALGDCAVANGRASRLPSRHTSWACRHSGRCRHLPPQRRHCCG